MSRLFYKGGLAEPQRAWIDGSHRGVTESPDQTVKAVAVPTGRAEGRSV